ncbi:unnamed protein product [Parascedosporium putredinis]|uniref:Uncharacterized protein n=1 Tax=Parascedosporium putredinis TaxID=1442378 RepID=A0A9P1H0N8_9PEZI|nr:unnamed protein product [Parascedosporium putredinis]CAI7994118.1 unnamed protein product [Parascedosporium putredinis]
MGVFKLHIYLTQPFGSEDVNNITVHCGHGPVDPVSGLKTLSKFGRPRFGKILGELREDLVGEARASSRASRSKSKVNVYYYGVSGDPASLRYADDLKEACTQISCKDVVMRSWVDYV